MFWGTNKKWLVLLWEATAAMPGFWYARSDFLLASPDHFPFSQLIPAMFLYPPHPRSSHGFMHMRIQLTAGGQYILGQFSRPFNNIAEMINYYTVSRYFTFTQRERRCNVCVSGEPSAYQGSRARQSEDPVVWTIAVEGRRRRRGGNENWDLTATPPTAQFLHSQGVSKLLVANKMSPKPG